MDAKEIQIHPCQKNQRMDSTLFKAIRPERKQRAHLCRGFTSWNRLEADSLPPIERLFNDVGVLFFILPRVSNATTSQNMKVSNRTFRSATVHQRHRERMFRVARRITRHRDDAQDAVQESLISAYVHLEKFDERARFSTWLTRIAINAALMKVRKNRQSRKVGVEDTADAVELRDSVPSPEEIELRREWPAS
jgi:hypothetical protein